MQKPACKTNPDCPVTECKKEPFTQNGITATVGRLVEQFAATWHENFRHKLQCARTVLVPDVCAALSSRRVVFRLFRKVVIYWCISKLIVTNRKPPPPPVIVCPLAIRCYCSNPSVFGVFDSVPAHWQILISFDGPSRVRLHWADVTIENGKKDRVAREATLEGQSVARSAVSRSTNLLASEGHQTPETGHWFIEFN